MRTLVFAKRNTKELLRDPLSLIFCILFPVLMMLLFRVITFSFTAEELEMATPQFTIKRLAPAIAVFGFSFLSLFTSLLISKDRTASFLARLKTSPMRAHEFIIGYSIPLLPIAFVQIVLCYVLGFIFGLKWSLSILISIPYLMLISVFFIELGVLFGIICSDKSVGAISSIIINLSAIFSGMFMPLDNMHKAVQAVAYSFPFANILKINTEILTGDYTEFWWRALIVVAYMGVTIFLSVFCFKKKLESDSI